MDAFYGEIRIFGFNFPPENWSQCNGQVLQIAQYQALFTILGVQFGGDARNTFNLPNLMGSAVCNAGTKPGLSPHLFGKTVGATSVTLSPSQYPKHQHSFNCSIPSSSLGIANVPTPNTHLSRTLNQLDFTNTDTYDTTLSPQMVGAIGGSSAHENRQPFLAMNFCICLYGEYPIRS